MKIEKDRIPPIKPPSEKQLKSGYLYRRWVRGKISDNQGLPRKPPTQMGKLTRTEWAYLAGLFDGEGCIHMSRRSQDYGLCKTYYYPRISVHMNTGSWIDLAKKTKVGSFYKRGEHNQNTRWDTQRINDVPQLLKALLPYLRIKREQAIDMIRAIEEDDRASYVNPRDRKKIH